jgi:hypothetical protein
MCWSKTDLDTNRATVLTCEYLIKNCQCSDPLNSTKPCITLDDLTCLSEIFTEFIERKVFIQCKEAECPLECEYIYLVPYVSMANFPTIVRESFEYNLESVRRVWVENI